MNLLKRARAKRRQPLSDQELELVAAFLKDEVNLTQVMSAINEARGGGIAYILIARGAKELVRSGKLQWKDSDVY